ncbi:hypothetical protein [Pedobacter insulae]|uniref:Uncharacterized protein n=1 Tax=Pedobacter insulae TaxID=414048 RepID=A0A1I2XMS3_9SPHI|nr:hypothetical protein [Pedobacter insulae]SFH13986.1 hypothetical protein SAMN04489864_105313 [Pedobacter insulae]
MKKAIIILICIISANMGCGTVQSIIKSTFPYTATLVVPMSSKSNTTIVATSTASSFDQIFGNQNGATYIKEVRVASARLDASNPSNQNLGVFKSVKLYIINDGGAEVMVASRSDVSENIGNNLVLDVDNSRFIDEYVKGNNLRIKLEYVLRNNLTSDVSVRAAINLSSSPNTK